jgi:CelD/BcsL family acetyltransferase involved in cellulose biosynthesis
VIKYETIETYARFRELEQPWNELLAGNPLEDSFMRHEWFDGWIRSRGAPDYPLCIVTGWRDGQLVSIAPLQRQRTRMKSIPVKTLSFLQSTISPRCNFIATSTAELEGLLDNIRQLKHWDILIASNIEESQPATRDFLAYLEKQQMPNNVADGFMAPYLDISGTWEEHLATMSGKRRRFIRRECLKKLESAQEYSFECIRTPDEWEQVFKVMMEVSARSWKADIGTAIGQVQGAIDFYTMFTPKALVRIWLLKINGQYAGFDYYLHWKTINTGVRSDYDKDFAFYHPGENLKLAMLKHQFDKGKPGVFDFGGVASDYKTKWARQIRRHLTVTVPRGSLIGKAIMLWKNTLSPMFAKPEEEESVTQ